MHWQKEIIKYRKNVILISVKGRYLALVVILGMSVDSALPAIQKIDQLCNVQLLNVFIDLLNQTELD